MTAFFKNTRRLHKILSAPRLQAEQQAARVLDLVAHGAEEEDGFPAVDEPVVVRQREVHDRPDLDLALREKRRN